MLLELVKIVILEVSDVVRKSKSWHTGALKIQSVDDAITVVDSMAMDRESLIHNYKKCIEKWNSQSKDSQRS